MARPHGEATLSQAPSQNTAGQQSQHSGTKKIYIPEMDFPALWRGEFRLRPRAEWEHDRAFLDVAITLPEPKRASSPGPVVSLVPEAMPMFGKELMRMPQARFLIDTYGRRVPLETFAVPDEKWNRDVQSQIELLRVISIEHLPHVLAATQRMDPSGAAIHALWTWIRNIKADQFPDVTLKHLYKPSKHHCVIDGHRWERVGGKFFFFASEHLSKLLPLTEM